MDPNAKPVEDPKPEPVDLAKVRQTLGLPETATEAETVGALLEVVAVLRRWHGWSLTPATGPRRQTVIEPWLDDPFPNYGTEPMMIHANG